MSLPARYARLLPDFRTLFLAVEDLDEHRLDHETHAEALVRFIRYADALFEGQRGVHHDLARRLVRQAGLPKDDELGLQLAMAMVARARFLADHPPTQAALEQQQDGDGPLGPN